MFCTVLYQESPLLIKSTGPTDDARLSISSSLLCLVPFTVGLETARSDACPLPCLSSCSTLLCLLCRYKAVWLIFFILGLGTLLPWNFFMTARQVRACPGTDHLVPPLSTRQGAEVWVICMGCLALRWQEGSWAGCGAGKGLWVTSLGGPQLHLLPFLAVFHRPLGRPTEHKLPLKPDQHGHCLRTLLPAVHV